MFTLPEFYALYIQFDLHPEKVVFDRQQVSGIKWFLWDSQFGRFVNKGPISQKSGGDVFFYLHTLLWAFAPWCLLFYYAVYKRIREIFGPDKPSEFYTIGGAILLLLLFSLSRFQLPFYANTIFPLFSIITAPYCLVVLSKAATRYRLFAQWSYIIAFPVVIVVINYFMAPAVSGYFIAGTIVFGVLAILISLQIKTLNKKTFLLNCVMVLFANFYLSTVLYKEVAAYNGQIIAARYVNQNLSSAPVYSLKEQNNVFQFYVEKPVGYIPLEQFGAYKFPATAVFYANQASVDYLNQQKVAFKILQSFTNYPQEQVLPNFVNKPNRYKVLDKVYLITR